MLGEFFRVSGIATAGFFNRSRSWRASGLPYLGGLNPRTSSPAYSSGTVSSGVAPQVRDEYYAMSLTLIMSGTAIGLSG